MIEPRLFLCSGATVRDGDPLRNGRKIVELDALGPNANVNVRLQDVAKALLNHVAPRLVDLLEIAAYVFCADAATRRGNHWTDDHTTEPWGRDFRFLIPVRDLSFWRRAEVGQLLVRTLQFLSDDAYSLEFRQLEQDRPVQEYLEFRDLDWPFYGVERVLMFSGGLDSLAGAVETAARGENLVLVSHRSVTTLNNRQRRLFQELQQTFPSVKMTHVPVWINKEMNLGREATQRTRSFLFAAIGTVVAQSIGAEGVRFFENGVGSLNLPVADEVLRARASRTTHPQALHLLSELCSLVTDRQFVLDNPYLFMTKSEVVASIVSHGAERLIGQTCSCAHLIFQSKNQWHCGACSQCIDRRIAVLAAGQEAHDKETDYVTNVFTGPRKDGYERNIAVGYARHANELHLMSEAEMARRFNLELSRAVRCSPRQSDAAQQFVEMYKRHSQAAARVIDRQIELNAGRLRAGSLEPSCMIALIAGQQHRESSWTRFGDRLTGLLTKGLPKACKTHKPRDEPHLQEISDGILVAQENDLTREFPYMRWSSSLTKPDWSAEALCLWIEMKYVRKRTDIRQITEDIAADITKYGDNGRRTLFVVYDPGHLIVDEAAFSEPIERRPDMRVRFVR